MHHSSDTGKKFDEKPVSDATTPVMIQISTRTQSLLDSLKNHPDDSYDAVILRLCSREDSDAPLSDETLKEIEESLANLRKGIFHTHEKIVQELVAGKKK